MVTLFRAGIVGVVNLQTPREHSHCGQSLETSGFTYCPEELMAANIYYYNYALPDYSSPTLEKLMDIVKVIDFSCGMGKAIHCHTGLGNSGLSHVASLLDGDHPLIALHGLL